MGERLGLAARARRPITYAQLAEGLNVQLPNEPAGPHQLSDILGHVSARSKAIIDEYLFVLTCDSYREARLLANALLISGSNQPVPAFFEGAGYLHVRVPQHAMQRFEMMWARELAGVLDWFGKLPPRLRALWKTGALRRTTTLPSVGLTPSSHCHCLIGVTSAWLKRSIVR